MLRASFMHQMYTKKPANFLWGQENSAFCMRLREFNLHTFMGPSMLLDVRCPDSQCHFNDTTRLNMFSVEIDLLRLENEGE